MSLALAKTGSSFVPLPGTVFVTENCGTKVLNVDHVCLLTTRVYVCVNGREHRSSMVHMCSSVSV